LLRNIDSLLLTIFDHKEECIWMQALKNNDLKVYHRRNKKTPFINKMLANP